MSDTGFKGYLTTFLQSRILFYIVLLLLLLKIVSIVLFTPLYKNIFFADVTKSDIVQFLNRDRAQRGLSVLTESQKLDQAAYLKAEDMVAKSYFSHQSPDGITPWFWFKSVDYTYKYAGENLAIGFTDSKDLYNAWFNSTSHRENILNQNYKEVGTAIVSDFGKNNAILVVQLFGSPLTIENQKSKKINQVNSLNVSQKKPVQKINSNNNPQPTTLQNQPVTQKVLSQSTDYYAPNTSDPKNNSYLKYLNYIFSPEDQFLKYISYLLLAMISVSLLITVLKDQRQKDLVFKYLILILIILTSMLLDNISFGQFIPHQIV